MDRALGHVRLQQAVLRAARRLPLAAADRGARRPPLDFRAIRFPGLISAETLPTGGTTDYAPEMIHAAAQGKPYDCFVAEETRLPFMTMPDARRRAAAPGRRRRRRA